MGELEARKQRRVKTAEKAICSVAVCDGGALDGRKKRDVIGSHVRTKVNLMYSPDNVSCSYLLIG